jgi:polyprenyl-phospho-N-acetylgalactosaminyl synthase
MRIAVLMPVWNDPDALVRTLRAIRHRASEAGDITVFVVDDGSTPPAMPGRFPTPDASFRIVLARHTLNLGQGAALETARKLALRDAPFDAYVTMDADGQHRMEDLCALVRAIRGGADVAFGNRFEGVSNVPALRRVVLYVARLFENVITGMRLSDAHNGFRAFSYRAVSRVHIRQNRMAHATEIRQQISREARVGGGNGSLRVVEVPVSVHYSTESLARGQTSLGAFAILRDLFHRYLFGGPQ